MTLEKKFTAVILAADRNPDDPVAAAAGVSCKCMAPVAGVPMLLRVMDALQESLEIDTCIVCGPDKAILEQHQVIASRLDAGLIEWVPHRASPSASAFHVLQNIPPNRRVLVTTADHALLRPDIVNHFCAEARSSGSDLSAALATHEIITTTYPGMRRTVTRLRDGAFCFCNLFAFCSPRARQAAEFYRRVEAQRKKPLRVVSALGWMTVLRFALGRLSLGDLLDRVSQRLQIRVGAVLMPYAEAAVDVDTVSDWHFAQSIAEN